MIQALLGTLRNLVKTTGSVGYHIAVVALSAGIALSLPVIARNFLVYWSLLQDEEAFLVTTEIMVAIVLIVFFNYVRRSVEDGRLARISTGAGLVSFSPRRGYRARQQVRELKEKHGAGRTVMLIGSTGHRTFVDPHEDLHTILENCIEAKVLLVNPHSRAARMRVHALQDLDLTMEGFLQEVRDSIRFLKSLKAGGKDVHLKLYSDPPLVRLVILGDYIWLQHYHTVVDVQAMPEYVFRHNHNRHGLYSLFYQYFARRWKSPEIPEYDLETDELVYRKPNGEVLRREPFERKALAPVEPEEIDERELIIKGGEVAVSWG